MAEQGEIPTAWIERLFGRFQAMYGNKMALMWQDTPAADVKDAWRTALRGLDIEQIKMGLVNLPKFSLSWPPTLPEFLQLCRREVVRPEHRPALLPPETRGEPIDPEVRLSIMASLERAARGLPRHGVTDMRQVFASTLAERFGAPQTAADAIGLVVVRHTAERLVAVYVPG